MHKIKQFIRKRGIFVVMLLLGLYYGCNALWNLSNTLLFAHEAVRLTATVIDVRQRPFESYTEALRHGNLPWDGDIAYRPIVSFIMPAGIPIRAYSVPDLDNRDYKRGEQVEIITHAHDPNQAHLKRWKFQWGADCMLLAFGLLLGVPSWFILFPRRKSKPAARPRQAPQSAQREQPHRKAPEQVRPRSSVRSSTPSPRNEEPFALSSEPPPPSKKPRAPRKKKADTSDPPQKTRAPRRKKEAAADSPPKPRKSNRKKQAP